MDFSELAMGTSPYLSYGKADTDYFNELIGNFVKDAAMDSCALLKRKDDTKYRYVQGTRLIQPKDAKYLYDNRDYEKFTNWVWERMDDTDSMDGMISWFEAQGIKTEEPEKALEELMEEVFLGLAGAAPQPLRNEMTADLKLIDEIEGKIRSLHKPKTIPVPEQAAEDEQIYINELMLAYGDAEGSGSFTADDFDEFPEYAEDLADRRVDFYAAEAIKQGVRELKDLSDQFDVLKKETYAGVKDTARRSHDNGYERMLAVMEQAVKTPTTDYLLGSSPYWINNEIRKGVCHHLVNEGKLRWVKRRKAAS